MKGQIKNYKELIKSILYLDLDTKEKEIHYNFNESNSIQNLINLDRDFRKKLIAELPDASGNFGEDREDNVKAREDANQEIEE